jgi:hypothetical protein
MTSDLLERLRKVEGKGSTHWYRNPDGPEAAAEIERLRGRLKRFKKERSFGRILELEDEIERLQRVVDAARKVIKSSRKDINLGPPLSLWGLAEALRELEENDE